MNRNKIRFIRRRSGIVIFLIGFIFIVLTDSALFTETSGGDSADMKIQTNSVQHFSWSPLVGVAVMAFGSSAFLMGINRK